MPSSNPATTSPSPSPQDPKEAQPSGAPTATTNWDYLWKTPGPRKPRPKEIAKRYPRLMAAIGAAMKRYAEDPTTPPVSSIILEPDDLHLDFRVSLRTADGTTKTIKGDTILPDIFAVMQMPGAVNNFEVILHQLAVNPTQTRFQSLLQARVQIEQTPNDRILGN